MGWFMPGRPSTGCSLIHSAAPTTPSPQSCPAKRPSAPPARPPACPPPVSKVISPCSPVLEEAVKSVCGGGRLLFSLFVLLLIMAAIYWLSVTNQPTTANEQPAASSNNHQTSDVESWSQSHVNSIPQIAPMYHNVVAQTSQTNFLQQQQQQQANNHQPMQPQPYFCYPSSNQQAGYSQNQYGQPYQQDPFAINQPQQHIQRSAPGSIVQPMNQQGYNIPQTTQNQQPSGYGSLPVHILDQLRPYIGSPGPIFILPNNCPNPITPPQAPATPVPAMTQGCPGIGINCPSSAFHCPTNSCYPYAMPVSLFNPFNPPNLNNLNNPKEQSKNCGCCVTRNPDNNSNPLNFGINRNEEHNCLFGNDDTICTKRNCPSAINLQALVSQLLAIQGIISCAAARLVLRKIPGSNVTSTMEDTIERAKRSLNTLSQEQLLAETRNAQQVNALINLHMTANPPPNVIPVLTTIQLKINTLKAHVESSINRRLSESQGIDGAEGKQNLDPVILALKSDQELRDLLSTLRQKECEERVNLNFAPYQSQRVIAEFRLSNIQNKIAQVETEMDRRRGASIPRTNVAQHISDPGCGSWYGYSGDISNTSSLGEGNRLTKPSGTYDSPDPFRIQVKSPKRLNLRPHVGSPETTYDKPKKPSTRRNSRSRKTSDDEDCDDSPKNSARDTSNDARVCTCERSSDDDSGDEGKKKLGGKIIVGQNIISMSEGESLQNTGISIFKLSPNVVIVIDNSVEEVGQKLKKKVSKELKNKAETFKSAKSEAPQDLKTRPFLKIVENNSDKTTSEKLKKFKWGKKKDKVRDPSSDQAATLPPQVEENKVDQREENDENRHPGEDIVSEEIDYTNKSKGPVREQTVRMITKIDYEPSAFRAYMNTADPPEKDLEEHFKGSFTEDSLKSTSVESTVDHTPESISLHVEDYEEVISSKTELGEDSKENLQKELQMGSPVIRKDAETEQYDELFRGEKTVAKRTSCSNKIHHNDEKEETTNGLHWNERGESSQANDKEEGTEEELISGDLSTIGNHVASFGSIIGKIATLKLQREEESSNSLFAENSIETPKAINLSVGESEGSSGRGHSSQNEDDTKKEIGRWKYIKFTEVENIPNASNGDESSDSEATTYTLPKIKHSVIEDKSRGEKYVVVEKPSEERSRRLGEPYKTGRSLLIRSHLKSPESSSSEQPGPFTLVKSPKPRDKNCLPLRIVSSRSSQKNRCRNPRELKSSDKFWIRTDCPETEDRNPKELGELIDSGEKCKLVTNDSLNEARSAPDSVVSIITEHVVEVHDYSKVASRPGNVENADKNA